MIVTFGGIVEVGLFGLADGADELATKLREWWWEVVPEWDDRT